MKESESEVAQSCPTLGDPMDCNLSGSSVRGIFQAIALEWIAISFSSGSSQPSNWTQVSRFVDRRLTVWATREIHMVLCCPLPYAKPQSYSSTETRICLATRGFFGCIAWTKHCSENSMEGRKEKKFILPSSVSHLMNLDYWTIKCPAFQSCIFQSLWW